MGSLRPRDSIRARKARSGKPLRGSRRQPVQPDLSKPVTVDALPDAPDGVPATALREIHRKLDIASAVAYVCAATLRAQAADYDTEVALCLQRCVGDALFDQMQYINRLLGVDEDEDGGPP